MGGRLACLGSEKEKIFAIDLCKSKSVKNCWVGATDEDDEGHWKWVDGSNVRVSGKNIDNELGAEHYLVIHVPLNDLTDSLSIRTPYLCEWDH